MSDVQHLDDGREAGCNMGRNANALVGFHGVDPVDQAAVVTTVSTTVPLTISSGFGFNTSAQMIALIAAVNSILTCLKEKGLMASS